MNGFESHLLPECSGRGEKPVGQFLRALSPDAKAKCVAYLRRLEIEGNQLPANIAKHVEDDLWELRPEWGGTEYRIFYFTLIAGRIYVVHAVSKKQQKTKRSDIDLAKTRVAEIKELAGNNSL